VVSLRQSFRLGDDFVGIVQDGFSALIRRYPTMNLCAPSFLDPRVRCFIQGLEQQLNQSRAILGQERAAAFC
jgi:hypothetical protein